MEIPIKKYGMSRCLMMPLTTRDIRNNLYELIEEFNRLLESQGLIKITDIEIIKDVYHQSVYCVKEDCHLKKNEYYDVEDCIDEHSEYVRISEPYVLITVTCKVIPKKYIKYKSLVQSALKKKATSIIISNEQE